MVRIAAFINSINIRKLDLPENAINFSFEYTAGDENKQLEKKFVISENTVGFVIELMKEIREKIRKEYSADFTSVVFGKKENDEEVMRDKLVDSLRKILLKVNELKKTKDAGQYMKQFHAINSARINL